MGDALGSAVLTARLVRDAMHLALLMARRYAPYSKWLGTAFARLDHADGLDAHLLTAVRATDLRGRERGLVGAYEALARRHGALPGATALDPSVRRFHDRPALVLDADRFADDCRDRVTDAHLRSLPLIGSVDQLSDSTDLHVDAALARRAQGLYGR